MTKTVCSEANGSKNHFIFFSTNNSRPLLYSRLLMASQGNPNMKKYCKCTN